jgi:hypothetical protein
MICNNRHSVHNNYPQSNHRKSGQRATLGSYNANQWRQWILWSEKTSCCLYCAFGPHLSAHWTRLLTMFSVTVDQCVTFCKYPIQIVTLQKIKYDLSLWQLNSAWKFGFCRDMSLALVVLEQSDYSGRGVKQWFQCIRLTALPSTKDNK